MQINVIDLIASDKKAMMVGGMKIISNKKHRKLIWSKVHAKKIWKLIQTKVKND